MKKIILFISLFLIINFCSYAQSTNPWKSMSPVTKLNYVFGNGTDPNIQNVDSMRLSIYLEIGAGNWLPYNATSAVTRTISTDQGTIGSRGQYVLLNYDNDDPDTIGQRAWGSIAEIFTELNSTGSFSAGDSTDPSLTGIEGAVHIQGSGDVPVIAGLRGYVETIWNSTSTIDRAYGLYGSVVKYSGSTITNAYGVYVPTVQGTNTWGLFILGGANNFINGNLILGNNLYLGTRNVWNALDSAMASGGSSGDATSIYGADIDTAGHADGKILVYRTASGTWVEEDKPTSTGSTAWGDITGTLSSQTDLSNALGAKADTTHLSTITGDVQQQIDGKQDLLSYTPANIDSVYTIHDIDSLHALISASIPTALSDLSEDATHRTITDTEQEHYDSAYVMMLTAAAKAKLDSLTIAAENLNALITSLAAKQDELISGTNIKTVNNNSLVGPGNVVISAGVASDTMGTFYSVAGSMFLTPDSLVSDETLTLANVTPATLGDTVTVGQLCYLSTVDRRWHKADLSDTTNANHDLGFCLIAGNDGDSTRIMEWGRIRSAAFPVFTQIGGPVYMSTTGAITETKPTTTGYFQRIIGFVRTPNEIKFMPSPNGGVLK